MRGNAPGTMISNLTPMRRLTVALFILLAEVLAVPVAVIAAGAGTPQPVSQGGQPAPIAVHWVRAGDTLLGVAWRGRVTGGMIKQANGLWTGISLPGQRRDLS